FHSRRPGKGPFAYEEGIHIPLIVTHPEVSGGQSCRALTSHIDIVPTLLSRAGVLVSRKGDLAGRDLPGKDLMPVLATRPPPICTRRGKALDQGRDRRGQRSRDA